MYSGLDKVSKNVPKFQLNLFYLGSQVLGGVLNLELTVTQKCKKHYIDFDVTITHVTTPT